MKTNTIALLCVLCAPAWAIGKKQPAPREETKVVYEGTHQGYLELRAFAEGLYGQVDDEGANQRASDFKRRVDTAFEEARKGDMQRAYEMNLSAKSQTQQIIEDRFRVFSGLYDNPVLQMLTNLIGQSIVPPQTSHHYTFKLIADPVPWAESLSTGSIWASTGLVALLENKAQFCYVLAHEAAHAYLSHHRQRIMLRLAEVEYNLELGENKENHQKSFFGNVTNIVSTTPLAGALVSQVAGRNALAGNLFAQAASGQNPLAPDQLRAIAMTQIPLPGLVQRTLASVVPGTGAGAVGGTGNPATVAHTEWNRYEEDEADRMAFDWLIRANIDVREIPKVYAALKQAGDRDPRVTLGFLGRTDHVRERVKMLQDRLSFEQAQPGFDRAWLTTDQNFQLLLAEVKRDNGIFAFHHDMLETARENLRSAASIKTQDSTALYYYAKILAQTARTDDERKEADRYFRDAARYDQRNENYGSHLYRALLLLTKRDPTEAEKKEASEFLARYLLGYHLAAEVATKINNGAYPPHLEAVYDYMVRAGQMRWELNEEEIRKAAEVRKAGTLLADYYPIGGPPPPPTPPPQAPPPAGPKPAPPVKKR